MLRHAWVLLLSLAGCASADTRLGVEPVMASSSLPSARVEGTVSRIHFQNINKAKGHYTYNVSLFLEHDGIPDAPHESDQQPGLIKLRTHKVYWGSLSDAERAQLPADAPQHVMELEAWKDFRVGEPVVLDVAFWGPGDGARRLPQ
ncbi:MAG: hypothetical protein AAGA54_33465 [Myxococcota bacterium]